MVKQLAGNPRAVSMSAALLSKAEQKQEFLCCNSLTAVP